MLSLALFAAGVVQLEERVNVRVNGEPVGSGLVMNGRAMVPLRGVLERLGINVKWEPEKRLITFDANQRHLVLRPTMTVAEINGRDVTLDVAPQTIQGVTYVPLRLVGEAVGATVFYDAKIKTVKVTTGTVTEVKVDIASFTPEGWYFGNTISLMAAGAPGQNVSVQIGDKVFSLEEKESGAYSVLAPFEPPATAQPVTAYLTMDGTADRKEFTIQPDPFALNCPITDESAVVPRDQPIIFALPPNGPRLDPEHTIVSVDGPPAETEIKPDKITIQLGAGKSLLTIQTVDSVGKKIEFQREFKAAPYVGFESACTPLKPGDPVYVTVYARKDAIVRMKLGDMSPDVRFVQVTPGEFRGEYIARAEDHVGGLEVGAKIDSEDFWAMQPVLNFVPFTVGRLAYETLSDGKPVLEIAATPHCVLTLVDRKGVSHDFEENKSGTYRLEIPSSGFENGANDPHISIRSSTGSPSVQPENVSWNANLGATGIPEGNTTQTPTTIQVHLDYDPLLCLRPNSGKLTLNGKPCEDIEMTARGFVARTLPPLAPETNQAAFTAEDLLGIPIRFSWTFAVKNRR